MKSLKKKTNYRQIFTVNDKIGYQFIPNLNARVINENGGYFVKTNNVGFRSNVDFELKKKQSKRIIFLGDSNTAGDGVNNNERFSDLVAEHFNFESYNFALPGSGTDQQYLIWEEHVKNYDSDLIILGVLVENIERNKVAYRETVDPNNQDKVLTPKPFFKLKNGELVLNNHHNNQDARNISLIDPKLVQWDIPRGQAYIYKAIEIFRTHNFFKPIRKNLNPVIDKLRSLIIKYAYQPYPDYKKTNSDGYLLMNAILKKFIKSINKPIIILPIPTYHYYHDEAKPIYQNFFKNFNDPKNNTFVVDILDDLKKMSLEDRKKLCFKEDKSHFSPYGHIIISDILKKKIKELNLLKSKNINISIKKESIKKKDFILGISAFYHDSAAAIIKDGKIIAAAQEERFTRIKNDKGFPEQAINFCLEQADIHQDDLKTIIYYDNASLTLERILWSFAYSAPKSKNIWKEVFPPWIKYRFFIPELIRTKLNYKGKILQNLHHRSHLAAGFYPSPYSSAAILTIDGVGEWATATIGTGKENKIKILKEMNFPNSVGLLYSAFTQFTGFKVNSGEYKMMGLAPYGEPTYVNLILKNLVKIFEDGSIEINLDYFNFFEGSVMTNKKFNDLFGGAARIQESKITKREMDIACSIQKVTEKIILLMAKHAKELTGEDNLCLAGGVALNCVANGVLIKEKIFKNIWIQPAAGDAGSALGSALDAHYTYYNNSRGTNNDFKSSQGASLLGPEWSSDEILAFLMSNKINYHKMDETTRSKTIANFLAKGNVVGHFSGRSEFGPRALGARSILGDPTNKEMQTTINLKIKKRESFRPFAPAVLLEQVDKYFDINTESPHMLLVASVKNEIRKKIEKNFNNDEMLEEVKKIRSDIPAVTHVDYSARIQTVSKEQNKKFYDLIKSFEELTKCSLVINTSFNVRGEPIVNSPWDAFMCFLNTEMDVLCLENFYILKNEKKNLTNYFKSKKINYGAKNKKLEQELDKIYNKNFLFNIKNKTHYSDINKSSNWEIFKNQNIIEIFDLKDEFNKKKTDPDLIVNEVVKLWKNKKFAAEMNSTIHELIKLSKKYSLEIDNSKILEKTYEMY
jgi:carbamoyltransferase